MLHRWSNIHGVYDERFSLLRLIQLVVFNIFSLQAMKYYNNRCVFFPQDVLFLSQFMSPKGYVLNRRVTGSYVSSNSTLISFSIALKPY